MSANLAIPAAIFNALEQQTEQMRPHLGASIIGHNCERWLWLSFRWAVRPQFDGRLRRLFRRGHLEEPQVIEDLRRIGCAVQERDPKTKLQFQFADGHFAGSLDGIILNGLPGNPNVPHVLEVKTHSKSSFSGLVRNGVEKSKPQHWAQVQVYMRKIGLAHALYFAVCKDDDDIYCEVIQLDDEFAQGLERKAQRVISSDRLPPPVSTDPTWFECKLCAAQALCHQKLWSREVNCRTCAHATANRNGTFTCERWSAEIPIDAQRRGCDEHLLHPDLVPWQAQLNDADQSVSWVIDGKPVLNGPGGFKSREIVANPALCAKGDPNVEALRAIGAEVAG